MTNFQKWKNTRYCISGTCLSVVSRRQSSEFICKSLFFFETGFHWGAQTGLELPILLPLVECVVTIPLHLASGGHLFEEATCSVFKATKGLWANAVHIWNCSVIPTVQFYTFASLYCACTQPQATTGLLSVSGLMFLDISYKGTHRLGAPCVWSMQLWRLRHVMAPVSSSCCCWLVSTVCI
jgi:hypothetical protein